MKAINEKAVLVNFSVSQWTARKYDKKISDEVAQAHNADRDAGRYNKVLIALDEIKAIQKIANEARTYHYYTTLPWFDKGDRILTIAQFEEYTKTMREKQDRFNEATKSFIENYPALIEDAKARLNSMYNQEDYPSIYRIESKFAFGFSFLPLPDKEDFRVEMNYVELDKMKADVEKRVRETTTLAVKECYQRLFDVVNHVVGKLSDPDAMFHDTLIGNITRLCEILPRLNLTDDPVLESMRKEVEETLTQYDPEELRKDTKTRKEAALQAETMAGKIKKKMNIKEKSVVETDNSNKKTTKKAKTKKKEKSTEDKVNDVMDSMGGAY